MGKKNKISFAKVQSVFFFGLIGVFGVAMIYLIYPFLFPIFWAAIIAILFYPVYSWLEEHLKFKGLSSILTIILVIALVFLPLALISALVVNQSINLYNTITQQNYFVEELNQLLELMEDTPLAPIVEQAQDRLIESTTNIAKTATLTLINSAQKITSASLWFVGQFVIMIYTLFYFFKDGPKMLDRLMHLSPLGDKYEKKLFEEFTSTTSATLKGTFIVGGIQAAIGGILFWWAGIQGALIWTLIMLVFALIPAVGASIIVFIGGLVLLALGDIAGGVILVIGSGFDATIDNLIRPQIIGNDIQMHPLLVLFTTLGGLLLFGASGFIIGPIIASLFLSVISIYDYYYKTELSHN